MIRRLIGEAAPPMPLDRVSPSVMNDRGRIGAAADESGTRQATGDRLTSALYPRSSR